MAERILYSPWPCYFLLKDCRHLALQLLLQIMNQHVGKCNYLYHCSYLNTAFCAHYAYEEAQMNGLENWTSIIGQTQIKQGKAIKTEEKLDHK